MPSVLRPAWATSRAVSENTLYVGEPMLRSLLSQTDLGDLLSLVSPALFDVVSVPRVLRRGRQVMKESRRSWPERRAVIHAALPSTIELRSPSGGPGLSAVREPRGAGEHILTVYFCQLFWPEPTALDLRSSAWGAGRPLQWSPSATTVVWEPRFIESMRGVYRGFYAGDDSLFEESLAPLGLGGAADLFRAHFGGDDQRAVMFDRGAFVQSFGAIFEHCKRERVTLHEDFVLLGAYLAGLYDSLADLGVSFDVRTAFHRALAHVDVS